MEINPASPEDSENTFQNASQDGSEEDDSMKQFCPNNELIIPINDTSDVHDSICSGKVTKEPLSQRSENILYSFIEQYVLEINQTILDLQQNGQALHWLFKSTLQFCDDYARKASEAFTYAENHLRLKMVGATIKRQKALIRTLDAQLRFTSLELERVEALKHQLVSRLGNLASCQQCDINVFQFHLPLLAETPTASQINGAAFFLEILLCVAISIPMLVLLLIIMAWSMS